MIAYKMFNKEMECIHGRGVYKYEVGRKYREDEANCARNGFHCAENPLDCLSYYHSFRDNVCCEVLAGGSIDEDDRDSKISCTEILILKRLTLKEFVVAAGIYMIKHPKMPVNSHVTRGPAKAGEDHFAISRSEQPAGQGGIGDVILCMREKEGKIEEAGVFVIDGDEYLPGVWYDASGKEVCPDAESRSSTA